MNLDFSIDNSIAGMAWLVGGLAVATLWLSPQINDVRRDLGLLGAFRAVFGPDPNNPDADRVRTVQVRIFAFFGIWLGIFLVLDWVW
jgi:hypothetical protein